MEFSKSIIFKFPWLNGASQLVFSQVKQENTELLSVPNAIQYLFSNYPELYQRILLFFKNAIESKEEFSTPTDDETNLAMYPVLQIICDMLGNRILANALSNLYAKHFEKEMDKDVLARQYRDTDIRNICVNLNINTQLENDKFIDGSKHPFRMHYSSYLSASTNIKDVYWKLINRPLQNGYVYLIRHEVIILIRELIRKKTMPNFRELEKETISLLEQNPQISQILHEIADYMKNNVRKFRSDGILSGEKIDSDYFPPCIRAILFRSVHGENLSHYERLSLAFFFLNTNHTVEETIDLYRTSPDFDEKITRYQVEYAAGSGKGKKYTMFSCEKLKTLQICKALDSEFGEELCAQGFKKHDGTIIHIRNPSRDYIFFKKVILNRIHGTQVAILQPADDSEQKTP